MTPQRNVYKHTKVDGVTYLYPVPVIKENKYLVEVRAEHADFFIFVFKLKFLKSLDQSPDFIYKLRVHSDGNTEIFKIDYDGLHFNLLENSSEDSQKALIIEKLLSSKIISCLKGEEGAVQNFIKSLKKQMNCKTCQRLGILKPELKKIVDFF